MTEATRRIRELIEDADRQAGQIIVKAEVEARRYVAEVRERTDREAAEYARSMSALGEALISQAELLNRESERLLSGLQSEELPAPAQSSYQEPVISIGYGEAGVRDEDRFEFAEASSEGFDQLAQPEDDYSAGARLLATQMAVAGSSRTDIHDRLVNDFGISNPEPLLDSILGPG